MKTLTEQLAELETIMEPYKYSTATIRVTRSASKNMPPEHARSGAYTAAIGQVFGHGDTPEEAIEKAISALREINRVAQG